MLALALMLLGAAASAAPLRVSLDGLDAPDLSVNPGGTPEAALFVVAAGSRKAPSTDDEELSIVAAQALPPQPAPPDIAAAAVPVSNELGLAAIEAAMAAERTLGRFVPSAPPDPDSDDSVFDRVAISTQDGPTAAVIPAPPTPADLEQLREQRTALQWVVVPLVLAAMAVAWFGSRRAPRRHKGERQHERTRRSGRMHRA